MREITKLIKFSPRREAILREVKKEQNSKAVGIRVLCPTRWTVRKDSISSILQNYEELRVTFDKGKQLVNDMEMKACILGIGSKMDDFEFLFGLLLGELIFGNCDNVSKALQSENISASEGQTTINMTVQALIKIRNGDSFKLFWAKALKRKEEYDVNDPVLKRKRKLPSRFDHGEADHEFPDTPYEHYLRLYLEALDNVINRIKDRFNQPGYQIYMKMEIYC